MQINDRRSSVFLSGAGALFCLAALLGGIGGVCRTSGCAIYSSYRFLGLSFYGWGLLAFVLIGLLALSRRPFFFGRVYPAVVFGALIVDIFLLAYQTLFLVCTNCLIVGFLIGGIGAVSTRTHAFCRTRVFKLTLACWAVFCGAVSVMAAKEVALTPWAMAGPATPVGTLYFSPTCPSCEALVRELSASPDANRLAFVPVAKNEEDARRIQAASGSQGLDAVLSLFEEKGHPEKIRLSTSLRLWKNRAVMAAKGMTTVPVLVASAVPRSAASSFGQALPPGFMSPSMEPQAGSCSVMVEDPLCH